jgi:PhoPQ-activated pathogenicity-related protein
MSIRLPSWILAAGIIVIAGCGTPTPAGTANATTKPYRSAPTALDRYVATPDPAYAWKTVLTTDLGKATVTVIDMTSQTWLTTNEVNRTAWRHWLTVVRPKGATNRTGLLFITGGANRDEKPPKPNAELLQVAVASGSVVAERTMVPNQPLVFGNDGKERVEDDLIAYTWDKYLRTGDERWPARLPMTKSAVRAMDTVTAFTSGAEGGSAPVEKFVVAGGSKRGWTTWTTAAVDRRVVAICPIVIDLLNIEPSFVHHHSAYGFYAPAVGNYVEQGIMNWQGTPEYAALMKIEEPFEYRDRLTMPKLMLNACGDQFFLPDSSQFYFDRLEGPKFLRYVPNTDHSMRNSDAYETIVAWQHAVLNGTPFPRFGWKEEGPATLRVTVQDAPKAVKLWQATNPKARDFRLETLGAVWTSTDLKPDASGAYVGTVTTPSEGWTAYMVELTYDLGAPVPLKLTTPVRVTPVELPHGPGKVEVKPKGFLSGRGR